MALRRERPGGETERVNVRFPWVLMRELRRYVPPRKRSQVIIAGTAKMLAEIKLKEALKAGEEQRTNALLEGLACLDVDREIAGRAGAYIRPYRTQGVTLGFADALVAATAVEHNLALVTRNSAHYPMPEVELLDDELAR